MISLRRHLQRLTWIALLAMLGLALAPTVSHALSAAEPWSEICSSAAPGRSGLPDSPAGSATHLQHCPLCSANAHADGLPPAEPAPWVATEGASFILAPFAQSPHPLFAWTAAPARAPPATR